MQLKSALNHQSHFRGLHDNFISLYHEREGKEMKFVVETCKKVSVEIHQQY